MTSLCSFVKCYTRRPFSYIHIVVLWVVTPRNLVDGYPTCRRIMLELVRNLVAHGDAWEGKWRGNWRMEWVASTLTPPPNLVYPALLKLMRTLRLPAVDWTDAPTDLNGLVRFGERRNLISARMPSRSARAISPRWSSKATGCHNTEDRKLKIITVKTWKFMIVLHVQECW